MPAHEGDAVPRFVLDQALAMAAADPDVRVRILAPHTPSSRDRAWPRTESPDGRVVQDRFRYAPRRLETLTARGIMPAIESRRSMAAVVPLLVAGERPVGDLARDLRISQPSASKHLKTLRDAGLVAVRPEAQRRLYRLCPEPLMELDAWLEPYRRLWTSRLDALERHLDEMDDDTEEHR